MAYMVFLGNFALPIPPSSITTSVRNKNSTMDLIDGTEINFLKNGGLTEFSFEFLLPHQRYPFVPRENEMISEAVNAMFAGKKVYDEGMELWKNKDKLSKEFSSWDSAWESLQNGSLGTAMEITTSSMAAVSSMAGMFGSEMMQSAKTGFLIGQLEFLKRNKQPFYFIVVRKGEGLTDFNLPFTCVAVSLEDYKIKEDAEAYGLDICVEVNLKQYKEYSTKFVAVKNQSTSASGANGQKSLLEIIKTRPQMCTVNPLERLTKKQAKVIKVIETIENQFDIGDW